MNRKVEGPCEASQKQRFESTIQVLNIELPPELPLDRPSGSSLGSLTATLLSKLDSTAILFVYYFR